MTEDTDSAEKEHEPTQKRLDEARARGEIADATDLATAASYTGFLAAIIIAGGWIVAGFGGAAAGLLGRADTLSADLFAARPETLAPAVRAMILPFLPLVLVPAAAVIATLVAFRAIVFAPDRIMPRLSRIDPIAAFAHRFGREGLFAFAKGCVKLVLVAGILALYLDGRLEEIIQSQAWQTGPILGLVIDILHGTLAIVLAISLVIGGLDHVWQRAALIRRNRMSRQDLIDEMRQSDGDPFIRQQRRQRAEAIATNRMLAEVPRADVVIVNPTHYAVALRWDRQSGLPPVCVAKGVDTTAARIREAAAAAGVPLRSDPPTARALYATVEIGAPVRPEHFRAVAAAIRFAERIRDRARGSAGGRPA
jgi:flagellar biosynthetic protein FlhB